MTNQKSKKQKKTFASQIEEAIYLNPQCPHCRRYDNVRMFCMLASVLIVILGAWYSVQEVHSTCCQNYIQLKEYVKNMNTWYKNFTLDETQNNSAVGYSPLHIN